MLSPRAMGRIQPVCLLFELAKVQINKTGGLACCPPSYKPVVPALYSNRAGKSCYVPGTFYRQPSLLCSALPLFTTFEGCNLPQLGQDRLEPRRSLPDVVGNAAVVAVAVLLDQPLHTGHNHSGRRSREATSWPHSTRTGHNYQFALRRPWRLSLARCEASRRK